MAKRKEPDTPSKAKSTPTKKRRQTVETANGSKSKEFDASVVTPSKNIYPDEPNVSVDEDDVEEPLDIGDTDLIVQQNTSSLFKTPQGSKKISNASPSQTAKADRSAKRKSAQTLVDTLDTEDWDNAAALAREILDAVDIVETTEQSTVNAEDSTPAPVTPSKRGRGRPAGAKNKRSPTPEGDHPPEERYFFQNRMGPPRVSSNIFSTLGLLGHEEYFDLMRTYQDYHEDDRSYLLRLHKRSFLQWKFELEQGFGICLYGYGTKRKLVNDFAEWLYPKLFPEPRIVMLNGYFQRINLRAVLSTIGSALVGPDEEMKLVGQPQDMLDTILTYLSDHVRGNVVIMVNSIDAHALRRLSTQNVLARLASHPQVWMLATADTPTFPILWNSTLKGQFRFLYHDCTTYAPYELETNCVDDMNELLGRKHKRMGGKDGVGFVLKSLPENARNLYRVLLTEVLTVANDGIDGALQDEDMDYVPTRRTAGENAEDIGIEYRALYQKATEEFICSSDMNFRFLLKEFHDHQMITSKRDSSGVEMLGVPLSRDEMEAVLEDLVLG